MENASKALLMAGGILIALLVIGALLLMFNQLSDYQKSNSNNEKQSQLVDFNKEFVQYTYSDIHGYEILTLINKIIDYNRKDGIANSVDYSKKISITINGLDKFNNKYAYNGMNKKDKLFKADSYTISATNNNNSLATDLTNALKKCSQAESGMDIDQLKKLSGIYNPKNSYDTNVANIREELKLLFPRK